MEIRNLRRKRNKRPARPDFRTLGQKKPFEGKKKGKGGPAKDMVPREKRK